MKKVRTQTRLLLLLVLIVILLFTFRKLNFARERMVKVVKRPDENLPGDKIGSMELQGHGKIFYVAVAAFAGTVVLALFGRKSSKRVNRKRHLKADSTDYNLKPVEGTPRLNGMKLRFYAWLSSSCLGDILVSQAFTRAKFDYFRNVHLPEDPTYFPNPVTFTGPKATPEEPHRIDLETFIEGPTRRTSDFYFFSISDYYNAYRKGITTPEKVAKWVIEKVKESQSMEPALGAVTQMDEDSVMKMAKESTERFKAGKRLSFLEGVPVLIKEEINCMARESSLRFADGDALSFLDGIPVMLKENFNTVPYHTKCGTTFLGEEPTKVDSTIARKLREAGAIIVGLTNMHELGMSVFGYNIHPDHGMPRNPYNPNHYTGGSSSGSAAAVAAGLVPLAIGTDGGGSIRIPATLCGNVGLKPTFGRVSFGGNEVSCATVVHAGPICTSVKDAALVYALLAGPDTKDPQSMSQPTISLAEFDRQDLKGIRIGVDWTYLKDANPDVVEACKCAIDKLREKNGAEIVDIQIPELQELRIAHTMVIFTEMRQSLDEHIEEHLTDLNPDNQHIMQTMGKTTARDYIGANKQRTRAIHFFEEIFKEVDVIVTPACGQTAPKMEPGDETHGCTDLVTSLQLAKYMLFGNLTGLPGLVVPIAYSGGLPIGLQIVGKWWEEDLILAVGKFTEEILREKKRPEIYFKNDCLSSTDDMV